MPLLSRGSQSVSSTFSLTNTRSQYLDITAEIPVICFCISALSSLLGLESCISRRTSARVTRSCEAAGSRTRTLDFIKQSQAKRNAFCVGTTLHLVKLVLVYVRRLAATY